MSWKYQIPLIVNKTILLQWFVDNDTDSPGDLVLFRTVSRSRNERTRYGSTLVVFQDQDSQGMYVFYCNTSLLSYIINISSLSSCYVWHDVGKHHPRADTPSKMAHEAQPKSSFTWVHFVNQLCTEELLYSRVLCSIDQVTGPLFQECIAANRYSKRIKVSIISSMYLMHF